MKRSFSVVYAKASTRKHKRWENDGILINQGNKLVLENDGKQIATSYHNNQVELDNLGNGNLLNIGNYEVEIQDEVFEQICGKVIIF
jgi:DNA repair and recombination protein RAD54B